MQIIVCKMDHTFQHILTSIFCALPSLLGNHWTLPEKQTGGGDRLRRYIFDTPWNFSFFYFNFTPGNSRQNKALHPWILQNYVRSLGNSKAKNWDPWKFRSFFLVTLGNSTLFLNNPWKFHMLFLMLDNFFCTYANTQI